MKEIKTEPLQCHEYESEWFLANETETKLCRWVHECECFTWNKEKWKNIFAVFSARVPLQWLRFVNVVFEFRKEKRCTLVELVPILNFLMLHLNGFGWRDAPACNRCKLLEEKMCKLLVLIWTFFFLIVAHLARIVNDVGLNFVLIETPITKKVNRCCSCKIKVNFICIYF